LIKPQWEKLFQKIPQKIPLQLGSGEVLSVMLLGSRQW
jgi:hypothetical protein